MSKIELLVGDIAPHFPTLEFIKGQPISAFESGRIYVLECWAPWCRPCIDAIPHISKLQKKYPKISFIGVAVWEANINDVHQVVSDMGDQMDYRVAYNTIEVNEKEGDVPRNWLRPAGEEGIPTAFIIEQTGKIAWFGHPNEIDTVLEKLINNEFDIVEAAQVYCEYLEKNLIRERKDLYRVLDRLQSDNDIHSAIKVCEEAFIENIRLEQFMGIEKLNLLIRSNKCVEALSYSKHLIENIEQNDIISFENVGSSIVNTVYQNTEIEEWFSLLNYAIGILIDLDQLTVSSDNYYLKFRITRSLALALLAIQQPQEALEYVELGLEYAIKSGFPKDNQDLYTDLISLCKKQISIDQVKIENDTKVICDSSGCRLK
ncbi:MAG: Thiol-disulfide oxidoreductase ResA [Acinetobacter bereziniae]|uniref:Thiol-disulfide oxidoreductase ResA n=1 Tax=Acinetobacter bereziniae TaxID=106648 RepID=A0A833PE97_ACIBZ|nr:MAG: Thiol-disulfide oxidoreductase ResA [Acinetobacter bereziniae]